MDGQPIAWQRKRCSSPIMSCPAFFGMPSGRVLLAHMRQLYVVVSVCLGESEEIDGFSEAEDLKAPGVAESSAAGTDSSIGGYTANGLTQSWPSLTFNSRLATQAKEISEVPVLLSVMTMALLHSSPLSGS